MNELEEKMALFTSKLPPHMVGEFMNLAQEIARYGAEQMSEKYSAAIDKAVKEAKRKKEQEDEA
jgi:hypothetical protein